MIIVCLILPIFFLFFLSFFLLLLLHSFLRLMDESPRWLAVRGQHQRALSILKRAARWNKVTLPPDDELIAILKSGRDEVKYC